MSQENQVTFKDYVVSKRGQIIMAFNSAQEIALKNFDDMTNKFAEQLQIVEAFKKANIAKNNTKLTPEKKLTPATSK